MTFGIHDVDIDSVGRGKTKRVRSVTVRFGDAHEICVSCEDGPAKLSMNNREISVALNASGPLCDFERAVNLLHLHLPSARKALE